MFLLLAALVGCGGEPETAEGWCRVAYEGICECNTSTGIDCTSSGIREDCATDSAAKVERWGEDYAITTYQCLADDPCGDWSACPAPPE